MNKVQEKRYYKLYGEDFVKSFERWIPVSEIEINPEESQFRSGGHAVDKVPALAEVAIDQKTDFPPVSVQEFASGKFGQEDGATRVLSVKHNFDNNSDDDGMVKCSTFVAEWLSLQPGFDWDTWRAEANNHPQQSPNTKDDGAAYVKRQLGELKRLVPVCHKTDSEEFIKEAAQLLKDRGTFSNAGWNITTFKNFVRKALGGQTGATFYNYTPTQAIETFVAHNTMGYNPPTPSKAKAGQIHNNIALYLMGKTTKMSPVVLGNVIWKKLDNPSCKCPVVYWEEKTSNLTPNLLKDRRKTVRNAYDKIQAKHNCFSGLYFLPQIKGVEDRNKLIVARP